MTHDWAVVGTGRMAAQFSRAVVAAGDRVRWVVSATAARAEAFCAETGLEARAVGGIGTVGEADFAYVASPNDRHAADVAELGRRGLPVLCEKPLAVSAEAARAIGDHAAAAGAVVGVAFQNRQHPAHVRARRLVADGRLGRLRSVNVSGCLPALEVPAWYDDARTSGGGILPMSGVHRIDLVRFITGEDFATVSAVTGHHRNAAYDDSATIAATLAGGAGCSFVFGLDMPYGDDRIAVHGTEGSIIVEGTLSQWWSDAPGTLALRDADGTSVEVFEGVDAYRLEAEDFARFAAGRESQIATVDDAIAVAEFSEAAYRSAGSGLRRSLRAGQA